MLPLFYWPLLVLALTSVYAIAAVIYNIYFHPLRKYPGPFLWKASRYTWAWHTFHGDLTARMVELQREYGDVVRIAPDELCYFKSQAWSDIYGHRAANGNGNLAKELDTRRKEPNGVTSIITANEEDHRRMRRLQSHLFSEKALQAQMPLINSYIDLLISRLQEKCRENLRSTEIDIVKWYNYTTFDILGDLAFGESFSCLSSDVLHPWIVNIFKSIKDSQFVRVSNFCPWPLNIWVYALAPADGAKARKEEFQFATFKARQRIQNGEMQRPDFMSYILKYNDEKGMTMGEIESNASVLIIAGSETTATFLSGITYNLLMNPTYYAKLRDLIRTSFADESSIEMTALNQLDFMTACIEESFRHYPPVPTGLPRVTNPTGSFIDSEFVPGNTIVSVHQYPAYMSSLNFADPELFVAERWLKGDECPERYRGDDRKVMQPFSAGPRNCIGRNLAYAEMKLILARMLWNFDFELMDDSKDWATQKVWFLWEKKPLNVKLTPRTI